MPCTGFPPPGSSASRSSAAVREGAHARTLPPESAGRLARRRCILEGLPLATVIALAALLFASVLRNPFGEDPAGGEVESRAAEANDAAEAPALASKPPERTSWDREP